MPFTAITKGAEEYFAFDFARFLPAGVTITAAAWTVTRLSDSETEDSNPDHIKSGSVVISGSKVSQLIAPDVEDVHYCFQCKATLSDGQKPIDCDDVWVRGSCE